MYPTDDSLVDQAFPEYRPRSWLRRVLMLAVPELDSPMREVVSMMNGLEDGKLWLYDEIADELGMTREEVHRAEIDGYSELRKRGWRLSDPRPFD
jgi:DNA-directed RNA polymerase specialized sigma24 family protein